MKLRQGYVFTGICDSVHWGGVHHRGVHGRGHARQGVCMVRGMCGGGGGVWQERWPMLWVVCILLECILVFIILKYDFQMVLNINMQTY